MSLFDLIDTGSSDTVQKTTGAPKASKTPSRQKLETLDKALDRLRGKYGENAVVRGSLLEGKSIKDDKNI